MNNFFPKLSLSTKILFNKSMIMKELCIYPRGVQGSIQGTQLYVVPRLWTCPSVP